MSAHFHQPAIDNILLSIRQRRQRTEGVSRLGIDSAGFAREGWRARAETGTGAWRRLSLLCLILRAVDHSYSHITASTMTTEFRWKAVYRPQGTSGNQPSTQHHSQRHISSCTSTIQHIFRPANPFQTTRQQQQQTMGCMSSKPYYGPNAPRDPTAVAMKTPAGDGHEKQYKHHNGGLSAMKYVLTPSIIHPLHRNMMANVYTSGAALGGAFASGGGGGS